jgi:hypothetical protein
MGAELRCIAHIDGAPSEVTALLETNEIILRGGARLRVPRASIRSATATDGTLRIEHAKGTLELVLGAQAPVWADRIANPRSLLDKLGVKAGMRVAVLGVDDAAFRAQLEERTSEIAARAPKAETAIIFFGADALEDLERLASLRAKLAQDGAIWVIHRKGKGAPFKDVDVFAAAKRAGLVDVKVAAFSETHTAEKLVIPVKDRR